MGNNETLTVPQPVADVLDIQATTAIPMPERAIYAYQRADGTVEQALSAEDAIARCPVLGRLAIEDPEQANVLLELAADGQEEMAAEVIHQEPKANLEKKPEVEHQLAESPVRRRDRIELSDRTTVEQAWHMAEMYRLMQEQMDKQQRSVTREEETGSQRQEPAIEAKERATQGIKKANNPARILRVGQGDSQPVVVREQHAADKPYTNSGHTGIKESAKLEAIPGGTARYPLPEDVLPANVKILRAFDEEVSIVIVAPRPNAQAPMQVPEAAVHDRPDPDRLLDFQGLKSSTDAIRPYGSGVSPLEPFFEEEPVTEEALPHSTDLAEADVLLQRDEAIFDDEVMDTLEQLIELVYGEVAEIPAPGVEQDSELIDNHVKFMNPETPEPIEPNAFEEFVVSIAKPEATPDLDTIIASANERALEETFVQLSLYLAEATQDSENHPVIQKTLRDLAELISSTVGAVAEKEKVAITPELTQKLLTLLRAVGYDDPQGVLLAFVKKHNFEFLLQAIRHLSQICNDDDRKELLRIQAIMTPSRSDEPLTARLGKAILSLMTRFKVPEAAISDS